ncbi:MAG: OB-fold domain-containing protein [Deltaproteobacteria bacterium]|nr:OB-fold domain-containing protein [Deltaproteobacteria bacterium]
MDVSIPPQPVPDADTLGFWEATAAGELAICRCTACRLWMQPPLERCRVCAAQTRFEQVSGDATICSFTVIHHPAVPGFLEDLPYVVAMVELVEQKGLLLPTRLLDAKPDEVGIGQRVAVEITDLPGGDYRVPTFRIVG